MSEAVSLNEIGSPTGDCFVPRNDGSTFFHRHREYLCRHVGEREAIPLGIVFTSEEIASRPTRALPLVLAMTVSLWRLLRAHSCLTLGARNDVYLWRLLRSYLAMTFTS